MTGNAMHQVLAKLEKCEKGSGQIADPDKYWVVFDFLCRILCVISFAGILDKS